MVCPDSSKVSRVPPYSGTVIGRGQSFAYGAVTRYGQTFQNVLLLHPLLTSGPARIPTTDSPTTPHEQRMRSLTLTRFGLFPVRSPLLGESRLISFPPGTEMFQFPGFAATRLCIQRGLTRIAPGRVSPFGHSRIKACLAAPRDFSQPSTSFIASRRQGIHQ